MSRVGNRAIVVPDKVKIVVNGSDVSVDGPKGNLTTLLPAGVEVAQEGNVLSVTAPSATRINRGFQGTARAVLANMVHGVTVGYEGVIEITGVGFKAELKPQNTVRFLLGFTEPRDVKVPEALKVVVDKSQTAVTVSGADKQVVFQILAKMRRLKRDDPFKGKGLKYRGEIIRRKAGKAGSK